ncbi:MAG: hypothetical protein PHI68_08250 [Candidatus Cloacimonetes bacterium]|nr:hypothetical protein [Candidatus Cloacimonadota bacterium]
MEISLGIYSSLYVQEGSAYDKINQALSQLNRYSELSPKLSKICETISEVLAGIESSAINLRDLGEDVSHDQSRLSAIRERLDLLNQLMHKHKLANLQALLEHRDQIASFLKDYSTQGRQIDELEQTVKSDFIILKANADGLSSARQEAAQRLCKDLEQNVRNLAIPDAVFQIRIDKKADPEKDLCEYLRTCTESGIDEVEYMFSANPGSSIKPLKSVVSGGELSRILLAIKRVLIGNISPKLIILDEIDAGIGGKTADCIAEYIKAIAKLHRVLCITHLAAIAAGAENHIAISKQIVGGKTRVLLESLDKQSKTRELARMLSGLESEVTLKHAEELMKKHKQRG